jgi:TP901 family phage tail tape measure protein
MAERTVTVGIRMQMAGAIAAVRNYRKAWEGARGELHKNMLAHREATTLLANTATVAGAALIAGVGLAIAKFAEFDAQMSNVNAVMRESETNMGRLREAALNAGKTTAYSATEAAQAIEELGKAGISTEDILSGGLDGALSVAAAGNLEVAKAAEIAALAMQQFGLSGDQIPHVADLLAAAAGKSLGSVEDLGMALQQSGLVANQFGLSVEDTTGALAAFAAAGLIGSDAGTSLKTMLMMLANPSKESADLMKTLGINAYDAAGNFVGLTDLAGQLQTKMAGLTQAQRDQALAQIFGSDALRAANVLYEEGSSGIQGWTAAVDDAGYASEVAAARLDNLKGDVEKLSSSIETALVESGSGANTVLRTLVQSVTDLVDGFSELPGPVQTTVLAVAAISGMSLLAVGGFGRLAVSAAETREALQELRTSGSRTNRVLGALGRGAGIASLAIGAFAVVNAVTAKEVKYDLDELSATIDEFGRTGRASGQMARLWGDDLQQLKFDMASLNDEWYNTTSNASRAASEWAHWNDVMGQQDTDIANAKERLEGLDQALADMVSSGNVDGARASFDELAAVADKQGVSVEELTAGLPLYQAALESSARTTDDVAGATTVWAEQLGTIPSMAEEARSGIQEFDEALRAITESLFGVQEAEDAVSSIVNQVTEEFTENGFSIQGTTDAAIDNRASLVNLTDAYLSQISAVAESTGSQEEAMAVAEDLEADFRALGKRLGLTEEQIEDYAAAFDLVPSLIETTVLTTYKYTGQVPMGGQKVAGYADGGYVGFADGGYARGYPTGGYVSGAGGPRTDSIKARLSNGEFVINARATKQHRSLLEAINSGRARPKTFRAPHNGFPLGMQGGNVRVSFDFTNVSGSLERAIKDSVIVNGGGDVQIAFGSR